MFKQRRYLAATVLVATSFFVLSYAGQTAGQRQKPEGSRRPPLSAYACLFVNNYSRTVVIRLVGINAEYYTTLRPGQSDVAEDDTAIVEGQRVVIVWDRRTGKRLDYKEVTIDKEKKFEVDNQGKVTITDW